MRKKLECINLMKCAVNA